MAELLLELFSEEIPAGAQTRVVEDLKNLFAAKFASAGVLYEKLECFTTPRRVAVIVDGLPVMQAATSEERRGPRIDAPPQAIDGFLKSTGLPLEKLEKRATPKGDFYFAVIQQEGRKISEFLTESIQDIINSYTWAKSMKWGNYNIRWIRPLHSIICIFDGEVLPISLGHVKAGNTTRGHRFLGNNEFIVKSFAEYEEKLEKHYVILRQSMRQAIIK
jgi:glycyl-tRNA synthetase beta chain